MTDLTDFLLARIAEDEEVARKATPGPWEVDSLIYSEAIRGPDGEDVVSGGKWGGEAAVFDTEDALHIARWDPARVLAECDAKRRIVLLANAARDDDDDLLDQVRVMALRLLALPYADHPDFREEWKL